LSEVHNIHAAIGSAPQIRAFAIKAAGSVYKHWLIL
jgi:hypothetical protein